MCGLKGRLEGAKDGALLWLADEMSAIVVFGRGKCHAEDLPECAPTPRALATEDDAIPHADQPIAIDRLMLADFAFARHSHN